MRALGMRAEHIQSLSFHYEAFFLLCLPLTLPNASDMADVCASACSHVGGLHLFPHHTLPKKSRKMTQLKNPDLGSFTPEFGRTEPSTARE